MEFPATLDQLYAMLEFVRTSAKEAGLSEERVHHLEVAAEEAVVNIISYAYGNAPSEKDTLSINCHFNEENYSVEFRDRGAAFNPLANSPEINTDLPLEERKIGGLGIYMMRRLTDEVIYEREGDENVLKLKISFRAN